MIDTAPALQRKSPPAPAERFKKRDDVYVFDSHISAHQGEIATRNKPSYVRFLLVRTFYSYGEATYRIQSNSLFSGLSELGIRVSTVESASDLREEFWDEPPTHILFHFFDPSAASLAKMIRDRTNAQVLCLGADIYDVDIYARLSGIVNSYIMPTRLHQKVIQSVVPNQVLHIPEAVDPICLPNHRTPISVAQNAHVCWFGYPESFHKSMRFVMDYLIKNNDIDLKMFSILTKRGGNLITGVEEIEFRAESFYEDTAKFSYALLSHFAYDLHLNSHIKSPNKLITAVVRGMVPLFSDTPSYSELAEYYELSRLKFRNGVDLGRIGFS